MLGFNPNASIITLNVNVNGLNVQVGKHLSNAYCGPWYVCNEYHPGLSLTMVTVGQRANCCHKCATWTGVTDNEARELAVTK